MEISDYMSLSIMEFKNNKATIALAVAVLTTLFFCSVSLSDLVSAYGSLRGGGGFAGGGGGGFSDGGSGEGRSSGHGGSPGGGEANIPTTDPSSPITSGAGQLSGPDGFQVGGNNPNTPNNPNSPIASGRTGDNSGSAPVSGSVGPHGPYGPGPTGPREPNNIDDNTITKNNIYAPRTLEGPVVVNPQAAPPTTESTSQTDITVAPTTTEEEQQQQDTNDDDGDDSTNTESESQSQSQNQIPIANAGPSSTVQPGSKVVLDGTKSYDPNEDSLSYLWLQLAGGQPVSLSSNNTSTPSFVAPSVTNNMMLTFELVVSDGQANSEPAYTYVTVQP
jgi:REJ domain